MMSDASKLTTIDLEYFIRFTLADEVSRKTSKRPTEPMRGMWTAYVQVAAPKIGARQTRGSDKPLRFYVCISALVEIGGESAFSAAMHVAELAGEGTAEKGESLRVRYHQTGTELSALGQTWRDYLPNYWQGFLGWRDWVLQASPPSLRFAMERFARIAREDQASKLMQLTGDLRADPVQRSRNELWTREQALPLEASLKGADDCRVPELAAYLAALKYKLGESREAIRLLDLALSSLQRCQDRLAPQRYRQVKRHCRLLKEDIECSQSERPRLSDPV